MTKAVQSIDVLDKFPADVPPVCVLFGDEPFLKRLVLVELRRTVLGDDGDCSLTTFDGNVEWHAVMDELSTMSLFGAGRRLVVIDDADGFVTRQRGRLEDYLEHPRTSGVLVLVVDTWPSNTRLAKALAGGNQSIDCTVPARAGLAKWLIAWATKQHRAKLARDAAELLIDTLEPELGLFDAELAKLAVAAGEGGNITVELVRQYVGGWRARTTWDMLDMATAGDAREALVQLDRLLLAGEEPVGLLAQISASLRRFAAATRLLVTAEQGGRKVPVDRALVAAGVKPFVLAKAAGQLKQIGRARGEQLYRWLLEADLALKGSSSQKDRARIVLELLIVRLSTATDPRRAKQPAGV